MQIKDIKVLPPEAIRDMVETSTQTELDPLIHEIVLAGGKVQMMHTTLEVDCSKGTLSIQGWGGAEWHVYPICEEDDDEMWENM